MSHPFPSGAPALQKALARDGFAFMPGDRMRPLLAQAGPLADWDRFAASWDDLALDTYMADGGRYRRRRHAVYAGAADGAIARQPHQPHYQSLDYNPLHGGVERWFEPITPEIGDGPSLTTIHGFCRALLGSFALADPFDAALVHDARVYHGVTPVEPLDPAAPAYRDVLVVTFRRK